jgi:hypothetical protein
MERGWRVRGVVRKRESTSDEREEDRGSVSSTRFILDPKLG